MSSTHDDLYLSLIKQAVNSWSVGDKEQAYSCLETASSLIPERAEATSYLCALAELSNDSLELKKSLTNLSQLVGDEERALSLFADALEALTTGRDGPSGDLEIESNGLRAAFIELDITPHELVSLQGYCTDTPRTTRDIHSPLLMQALLIEDSHGTRALWVSADLFAFDPEMTTEIKRYARCWGIQSSAVILNASHTHYAPGTLKRVIPSLGAHYPKFMNHVTFRIVRALSHLRQRLSPIKFEVGSARALLGIFRRTYNQNSQTVDMAPHQDLDRSYKHIGIAKITWLNSSHSLALINLGSHPTEFGGASAISSAFIGTLRSSLQSSSHADNVMFFQGCAGDHKSGIEDQGTLRWIRGGQEVEEITKPALQAIRSSLSGELREVVGNLTCAQERVLLPLNINEAPRDLRLRTQGTPYHKIFKEWVDVMERSSNLHEDETQVEVTHHRLGDWSLTAFAGEVTSAYARWVHQELDPEGFVLGYTNGLEMYLADRDMILEGGYEGDRSHAIYLRRGPLMPEADSLLKESVARLFVEVLEKQEQPSTTRSRSVTSQHHAFFVLSTGRSGTQTLAHLLDVATNARVWHHPEPNMIMETLYAYQARLDIGSTFWQGRTHIIGPTWDEGLIHGETDHNMTPFAPAIAVDIPQSRFLVLIRDPREFIRSGMRRGYYVAGGPWDEGRLKPLPEQARQLGWAQMSPFEKVCWLWAETYRHINRHIERVGPERVKTVRFEDLVKSADTAEEIFHFLGLDGFSRSYADSVLSQKLNAQRGGDFPHPRDWPEKWHQVAWKYCGSVAESYGYSREYKK